MKRKKRNSMTFVYLTDEEKTAVTQKAEEMGLSVSSLARQLLIAQVNGRSVKLATLPERREDHAEATSP